MQHLKLLLSDLRVFQVLLDGGAMIFVRSQNDCTQVLNEILLVGRNEAKECLFLGRVQQKHDFNAARRCVWWWWCHCEVHASKLECVELVKSIAHNVSVCLLTYVDPMASASSSSVSQGFMFRYTVFDSLKNLARMFWANGLGISCMVNRDGQLLARLRKKKQNAFAHYSTSCGKRYINFFWHPKKYSHFRFAILEIRRDVARNLPNNIGLVGLLLLDPLQLAGPDDFARPRRNHSLFARASWRRRRLDDDGRWHLQRVCGQPRASG